MARGGCPGIELADALVEDGDVIAAVADRPPVGGRVDDAGPVYPVEGFLALRLGAGDILPRVVSDARVGLGRGPRRFSPGDGVIVQLVHAALEAHHSPPISRGLRGADASAKRRPRVDSAAFDAWAESMNSSHLRRSAGRVAR